MKLLNIGERSFITPYGAWEPDDKADQYLAYVGEVKVLEDVKKEAEKAAPTPKQTKKKAK